MNALDVVTLVVDGYRIKCSKWKLAQNSDYFRVMFEGHFVERNQDIVTLNGVDFESLSICLNMLENRHFIPTHNLLMVLQTACMLQFVKIVDITRDILSLEIDASNCFDVWLVTESLSLKPDCLRAKKLALRNFKTIRHNNVLSQLSFDQLHQYLAHKYLIGYEIHVFYAFIEWCCENDYCNVIHLLAFIDINRLTDSSLEIILEHEAVSSSSQLVNVLKSVIAFRNGECVKNDLAQKLLNCSNRGYCIDPIFIGAEHGGVEENAQDIWRAFNQWICDTSFLLIEYKMVRHKQQIVLFGCQHIGEQVKCIIWRYDGDRKCFAMKHSFLAPNYVESCIIDNIVYFVVVPNVTFPTRRLYLQVYRLSDGSSHKIAIPLDCRHVKFCSYIDHLFLLYKSHGRGYIYDHEGQSFVKLYLDENAFPNVQCESILYSMDDRIFVEDLFQLVELRRESGNQLRVQEVHAPSATAVRVRDRSAPCHDTEYRIFLDNCSFMVERRMIYRDLHDYRIDATTYVYDILQQVMLPNEEDNLLGENQYVNTFENLFG